MVVQCLDMAHMYLLDAGDALFLWCESLRCVCIWCLWACVCVNVCGSLCANEKVCVYYDNADATSRSGTAPHNSCRQWLRDLASLVGVSERSSRAIIHLLEGMLKCVVVCMCVRGLLRVCM